MTSAEAHSKNVRTARITYSETSATPSKTVASPSLVISHRASPVRNRAPM